MKPPSATDTGGGAALRAYFEGLARYHVWATRKLYEQIDTLSDEDYRRDAGLFFKSVHGTCNHLLVAEHRVWYPRFGADILLDGHASRRPWQAPHESSAPAAGGALAHVRGRDPGPGRRARHPDRSLAARRRGIRGGAGAPVRHLASRGRALPPRP